MPPPTARCWRSIAMPSSIPAHIRLIRSRPVLKRRKSPASCRGLTSFPAIAAAPGRSPPTNRQSCHSAASRVPACASHSKFYSTPSRASLKLSPEEIRRKNLVRSDQMPFVNITKKIFDSGDYVECLERTVTALDLPAIRARQAAGEPDGRKIGVGLADLLRAGRARHIGLFRLGHSDGAGLRAGDGTVDAGWRARIASRRAKPRPELGDDVGADRQRGARHRTAPGQSWCMATRP